jgi:hypothetical protein
MTTPHPAEPDVEPKVPAVHFDAIGVDMPPIPFLESVRRGVEQIGKACRESVDAWAKAFATLQRFGLVDLRPARQRYSAPRALRAGGGAEYTRRRRRR